MQLVCITVWPKNHKCENQKSLTRVSLNGWFIHVKCGKINVDGVKFLRILGNRKSPPRPDSRVLRTKTFGHAKTKISREDWLKLLYFWIQDFCQVKVEYTHVKSAYNMQHIGWQQYHPINKSSYSKFCCSCSPFLKTGIRGSLPLVNVFHIIN